MKKILIVADIPGWIFHRHALEIKKRLGNDYQIDIGFSRGTNVVKLEPQYDCIYIMDPMQMSYPDPKKVIMGLRCEFMYLKHPNGAKGLYENGMPNWGSSIKNRCCVFHVVNKRQFKVFEPIVKDKPLLLVRHGVDETCFDKKLYPEKERRDKLVVGIVGRRGSQGNKGFDIIEKACEKTGYKLVFASYDGQRLTKEQMPKFYNQIDLYVCMSESEGLQNPTLEAGAMEVPVITTNCGAAEEMIVNGKSGLIIKRDFNVLCGALEKMKNDEFRLSCGNLFYEEIMKNWTWKEKIKEYKDMFEVYFKLKDN